MEQAIANAYRLDQERARMVLNPGLPLRITAFYGRCLHDLPEDLKKAYAAFIELATLYQHAIAGYERKYIPQGGLFPELPDVNDTVKNELRAKWQAFLDLCQRLSNNPFVKAHYRHPEVDKELFYQSLVAMY